MPGKGDWAAKSLRSGFGQQCLGTKPSSPAAGFGSSSRDAFAKQYASAEVDKAKVRSQGGDSTLGAAYNIPSTLEKQVTSDLVRPPTVSFGSGKRPPLSCPTAAPGPGQYKLKAVIGEVAESTKASAPRMRFGTAHRDAAEKVYISAEHDKSVVGKEAPGPGMYAVLGGIGKQQLSTKKSQPAFKLGTGPRFVSHEMREAAALPGPGAFDIPATIGAKVESDSCGAGATVHSSPTVKFGTSTRDKEAKVFVSVEHEKNLYGTQSPGPITATPTSAMGPQKLSTKKNSPCIAFGTGKRLAEHSNDVPGPGAYYA